MAHLLLIDALNLIRRLYAVQERPYLPLPDDVTESTKAQIVRNTENMLRQALTRLQQELSPSHALLVFDGRDSLWRKALYQDYKANRKPMPAILAGALENLQQVAKNAGINSFQQAEYEADDIIATIAKQAERENAEVFICTGDRDSFQLVNEKTTVLYPKRGVSDLTRMTPDAVQEKYGMSPEQYPDFAALRGDPSDNLPSVPGVGEKILKWFGVMRPLDLQSY